jgi:uncharacterized GH25 family protein
MTMNLRRAALLLGLFVSTRTSPAAAHDFWLEPREYWLASGARTPVTIQVGHGPFRQRSPIPVGRITRFQAIAPDGALVELRGGLQLGQGAEDGSFRLAALGTHVLVLQTDDRAQAHLPAPRFNDYLEVEGLTPALEQRRRLHTMDANGSERYSRCAKSIVLVGPPGAVSQSQVSEPIGLPLEIVPEVDPYRVPRSAPLPVHVIYGGRPLAGALVKLTNLGDDASPLEVHLTDREGRATFTVPGPGRWLLNVIWTRALPAWEEADFETVFSSLSFGSPSGGP